MRAFTLVWFGQVVSLLGTGMTQFAITIWAWEITGQATALALVGFFAFGPVVLFSPIAGALVDRWNRKLVMMLSDLAAGLATIAILILHTNGSLQIWHLYVAGAFTGVFQSFQFPAYSAAITTMIPKAHYTRASAMLGLADSLSTIFAPIMAGALLGVIHLTGILLIDIITFVFAVGTLLIVHIPQPETTAAGLEGKGNLLQESAYGFRYIFRRPSLLGLQLVFFFGNLLASLAFVLLAPMILARTGNDELLLGSVQSALGIGGVVGGLFLTVWGGPKRRVYGLLGGWVLGSLLGQVVLGLGQNFMVWAVGGFFASFFIPLINGSNQAIWQAKVAPDVQGRVFAVRRLIAQITAPVAMLIAGPLADLVFEPGMLEGGTLARTFGGIVGTGPGAGMALIFVLAGVGTMLVGVVGYFVPVVRNAELILPDHDAQSTASMPVNVEVIPVVES
ncbi:MAG: MFS transporter [Anaerolineaceae bacterium]|nr:MFS transporter [Anaerolineaceae bacterium]